jgi:hypothetical protein
MDFLILINVQDAFRQVNLSRSQWRRLASIVALIAAGSTWSTQLPAAGNPTRIPH